jgi:quercetin dioxygenase-like cupin family protein
VLTYLIEAYTADPNIAELEVRARAAAAAMSKEGRTVRYLRSVLIPADETCFHLVEATCAEAVAELARRANLAHERIIEAEESWSSREDPTSTPPQDSEGGTRRMSNETLTVTPGELIHRPSATGRAFWGPGDLYTFLVTGEESGGAYFAMEALVPTGGGPPPHVHRNEDETFYVLDGRCTFRLGDDSVVAGPGDFVNVPRGTVHSFRNEDREPARLILTFTPAGIEMFFEETLEPAHDPTQAPPDNIDEIAARYVAAAPRYGIEFLVDVAA